jgi:hypothetical protein
MLEIKDESLLAGGGFQGTHLVDANWKGFPELGPEGGSRLAGHNWRRDPNQTPEKMLIMQCHQSTRAVDPPCLPGVPKLTISRFYASGCNKAENVSNTKLYGVIKLSPIHIIQIPG